MRMTEKVNPTRYVVSTYVNITMYYYYMLINSLKKKSEPEYNKGSTFWVEKVASAKSLRHYNL
jgi:hypothetical protein